MAIILPHSLIKNLPLPPSLPSLPLSNPLSLPPSLPSSPLSPSPSDTSLELDFDALDDDLSDSGEHKTSSLSVSPSPPLSRDPRGLTDSGTSCSNLDNGSSGSNHLQTSLDAARGRESRDNLTTRSSPSSSSSSSSTGSHRVQETKKKGSVGGGGAGGVTGNSLLRVEEKDVTPVSPTGGVSLSLGSLDLDFDFSLTSFGLGTISEGRSLMNIPMTTTSETAGSSDGVQSSSGGGGGANLGVGGLQRSVSHQQGMGSAGVAEKGRKLSLQVPKTSSSSSNKPPPPKTAPKPRRGSYSVAAGDRRAPPGPPPTTEKPPRQQQQQSSPPSISKIGRQTSEMSAPVERLSSQQAARNEMMRSTPSLFPSPPSSRRNTDSLPRPPGRSSKVMMPLLPFQAAQELREAARQVKQESKKSPNGIIPQMKQGSPILLRRGNRGSTKQPSPPLSYRGSSNSVRHSPKHPHPQQQSHQQQQQHRMSPTSTRLYSHLSNSSTTGMKPSSSMSRLSPSVSRTQEEASSLSMSRNSSMDSGIQYSSEGENGGSTGGGGGASTSGERASNTSTASSTGAVSTGTSESVSTSPGLLATTKEEKEPVSKGLGDFSDLLSVIENMGGGDSLFS